MLAADGKSPLAPKSGDEDSQSDKDNGDKKQAEKDPGKTDPGKTDKSGKDKNADKADKPKPTRIDFPGLSERFVPIPVAERNYDGLEVASDGALLYLSRRQPGAVTEPPAAAHEPDGDLYRYSFEDREEKSGEIASGRFLGERQPQETAAESWRG